MATEEGWSTSPFADAHGDVFDACARCGQPFEPDVRYPVTTRRAPDGSLIVRSFCDDACQRDWVADD